MKKIAALVLTLIMVFSLFGCGGASGGQKSLGYDEAVSFMAEEGNRYIGGAGLLSQSDSLENATFENAVEDMKDSVAFVMQNNLDGSKEDKKIYRKIQGYKTSEEMTAAIVNYLGSCHSAETLEDAIGLMVALSVFEYPENTDISAAFAAYLDRAKADVFSENATLPLADYVLLADAYLQESFESTIDLFPYEEMRARIEADGILTITENGRGGYYDSHRGEYKDEQYWYSPLLGYLNAGEVGAYQHTEKYTFYGDFMYQEITEYWYNPENVTIPDDRESFALYYRGERISDAQWITEAFSMYLPNDIDVYFMSGTESISDLFVFIYDDGFDVFQAGTFFGI